MKKERDDSEGEKRAELERVEVLVKELLNEAGDRERERESERGSQRRKRADHVSDCVTKARVNELCVSVRFLSKNGSLELTNLGAREEVNDARAPIT